MLCAPVRLCMYMAGLGPSLYYMVAIVVSIEPDLLLAFLTFHWHKHSV